jgi:alpha-galactosidase
MNRNKSIATRLSGAIMMLALAWGTTICSGKPEVQSRRPWAATSVELRQRSDWFKRHFLNPKRILPFSFVYGGRASAELLRAWPTGITRRPIDDARTEHTGTWVDPATGLQVRCVAVEYDDYPVVEWTVYLKNVGTNNTPILENVQGLDASFERGTNGEFLLHGIKGDSCTADSYEPYQLRLIPNLVKRFGPPDYSGKSCDGPEGWPYYNLQTAEGGVILAVGWPGQWASSFVRDAARGLRIMAGQRQTHLVLKPTEEIRTPLMALLFWQGDDLVRSQNLWRRWYLAHNLPRVRGLPQPPVTQIQVDGSVENIAYVRSFLDAGINPDICWRDAGGAHTWYPSSTGPYKGTDGWLNTGTWEVDSTKYPLGFKPFSDWVRSNGMQFLLWFEPERAGDPNSTLATQHAAWLLPGSSHGSILNLGNPAAVNWLVNHVDGMIKSQGLDWYREDMNGGGPLPAWRRNDAKDRVGITENFYVQGHLAFWDELRRRNPGLRIDSCASGGRRNDLETMRRAVPLLRSDFQFPEMKGVVEGNQGHTYGLSSWLPFQGTGCYLYDMYAARSFYLPAFGMGGLNPGNAAAQKRAYTESARIAPLMLADYYPLTPYSRQLDRWIAWQFNRPERGDGMVQAFRRGECAESRIILPLNGLDPKTRYEVTDFDLAVRTFTSGSELMSKGLTVEIKNKPGAAVFTYRIAE